MRVLVTGAAGFIGSALSRALLERGDTVVGVDNLNPYYDPELKKARLALIQDYEGFTFRQGDITDYDWLCELAAEGFDTVAHVAAQAGVRYSIDHPFVYQESNNRGTLNLLELARHYNIPDFVFASSSSVYGGNTEMPFHEDQDVSRPVSLYAATKKSGELMCYTYHHLYGIRCRCLRFFTVYGPRGRPDMAPFKFTRSIIREEPIDVYNNGDMRRDFSYITDIISGVVGAIDNRYEFEIFNLAYGRPIELMTFLRALEQAIGKKALINYKPMQPGDVHETYADVSKARRLLGYEPQVPVEEGVPHFVEWYQAHYEGS